MSTHKISIIVPIYNAEKYLNRCLDSIINQSYKDWECILVDDGSTDGGASICDNYCQRDNRFTVIHKENGGVSTARQTGLDASNGDYVIHADPDDWVEPDWLSALYGKAIATDADMVICDFERIYATKSVLYHQQPTTLVNEDILVDLINGNIWGPCWNKLIKRKCFIEHHICFHPEMNLWEDLYVICLLVLSGIKVEYIPQALYHYDSIINKNGIVMHRKAEHIRSAMIFIDDLSPILKGDQFEDGWYFLKSKVKNWIFLIKDCQYDIKDTYPEINKRYIKDARKKHFWSKSYCVAFCLRGYPLLGHLLFNIVNWLKSAK